MPTGGRAPPVRAARGRADLSTMVWRAPSYGPWSYSCEIEREVTVPDRQGHGAQQSSAHHPGQVLLADPRQDGIGENRVDHAAAALDFRAPGDDQLHHGVVVRERHLVLLADAPGDPVELQADDVAQNLVR